MIRLQSYPALPVACGWIAGVLLWTAGAEWWIVIPIVAIGIGFYFFRAQLISLGLIAVAAGWFVAQLNKPAEISPSLFDGIERSYSGVIEEMTVGARNQKLIIRIDSIASADGKKYAVRPFRVRGSMLPDWSLATGDQISIKAVLEPIRTEPDFPHDRDMKYSSLRDGISAQTYLDEDDIKLSGRENSISAWFSKRREDILNILAFSHLSDEAYKLISAITVGYSDELDEDTRENFRAAGIAHALALSGFHVGIIVLITSMAVFPLRAFYRLRRARIFLSLVLVWFYALMVGMPISVMRAVIMLSVYMMAKILNKQSNSLNSLFAGVVIILAVSPFSIYSAGFQLSVCAVLGIIIFANRLNPFTQAQFGKYQAASLVTVPIAAVLGTLPVTIMTFHTFPLIFCTTNCIISLLLPLLMFGAIAFIFLGAIGIKAIWLCGFLNFLTGVIGKIADYFAKLPFAELGGVYLSDIQAVAIIAIIAVIAAYLYIPKRIYIHFSAAVVCIGVLILGSEKAPAQEYFIVNEKGNTPIVFKCENKMAVIFTCEERRMENALRRFKRRILPYVEARGVDTIMVMPGDFDFGPYSRRGNIVWLNGKTMGLAAAPGELPRDSIRTDYALICSRFRGSIEDVLEAFHPDTILLSGDLSLKRAKAMGREQE